MSNEVTLSEKNSSSDAAASSAKETQKKADAKKAADKSQDDDDYNWNDFLSLVLGFLKKWGWAVLLGFSVLLIAYYTLLPSRNYFHSDTTDTLMWAVASKEGGGLFNKDFNYACLLPFGTSMIMYLLIPLFGVSMKTHVIGMLIFFLMLTGAFVWMLREMKWSWGWISGAVFTLLFICSGSEKLREIFWGHTIYYSLAVLFQFVGLALLFRCFDSIDRLDKITDSEKRKYQMISVYVAAGLLFLWFALTGMNQIITIATFSLPVIGAVFCERWLDHQAKPANRKNLQALALIGVMAAGMLVGFVITKVEAKDIVAGYEGAFSNYAAMDSWVEHVNGFPRAWFSLLGVDMRDGEKLMSFQSVGNLLMVIAGTVILIVPVIALFCYQKFEDRKTRVLILSHWIMTLLIMFGYIFGKLSSANWRLSPIVGMSTVVTFVFFRWAASQIQWQRLISLAMIPVFLVCSITAVKIIKMPADKTEDNHLYKIAEALEAQNLSYGYATFWNANGVTVCSDSKVKVRNVTIDDNGCTPYRYQSCNNWYEGEKDHEGLYFLLMDGGERDKLIGSDLDTSKIGELSLEGYTVWLYTSNIFG
ncbi:MAG: hypothetical protein K6F80_00130 [Oscillospiraceae bacterium]|nr:hypothetical protein [Oscillospiraceae bacterium]